ncbi:hypothetical protein JHK82_034895 [Glycine max]|nr:hypothetical protein JHK85_035603 [Glycine max]KAG5111626.1 hypothetical protein JHK82_034895 [Glycine max]
MPSLGRFELANQSKNDKDLTLLKMECQKVELYIHIGWPLYRKYGHAFEVTKVVPTVSEEVKDYVVKNTRRQMTPTLEN